MTDQLLSSTEALAFVRERIPDPEKMDRILFGMYLTYDVVDSTLVGRKRQIKRSSLEAYLDLFPTGIYANHIDYIVKAKLGENDLTFGEAYALYAGQEQEPISRGGFQSLARMGVIPSIRTENRPWAPILGFRTSDIQAFVKLRKRLGKTGSQPQPSVKKGRLVDSEWLTLRAAYSYYEQHVEEPKSWWWFRDSAVNRGLFETEKVGNTYKVSSKSLSTWLESNATTVATTSGLSYPTDKAYFKFQEVIPDHVSLISFQKLVKKGEIPSITREGIPRVQYEHVAQYFGNQIQTEKKVSLSLLEGYAYYSQRVRDPVSRSQFTRWLGNNTIVGAKTNGQWTVTENEIDKFLEQHPSGRLDASSTRQDSFQLAKAQFEKILGIKP